MYLSVEVISLPIYNNVYRYFKDTYNLLDSQRFCSMVFLKIPYLEIYHILKFCTLVSITVITIFLDGVYDAVPVKMLTTNSFRSIYSWKKDIHIILISYIDLEY